MRISELKMALISVEDQLELLPLGTRRSENVFFVNYVNAIIPMWEIQLIYGSIYRKAISKNIDKLKKKRSKLMNRKVERDRQVMRVTVKEHPKVNQR